MHPRPSFLFSKKDTDFSDQSGGVGPEKPSAVIVASDGYLSLGDKSPRSGVAVSLRLKGAKEPVAAFLDPVYGWMDHNGVVLPAASVPEAWKPLL